MLGLVLVRLKSTAAAKIYLISGRLTRISLVEAPYCKILEIVSFIRDLRILMSMILSLKITSLLSKHHYREIQSDKVTSLGIQKFSFQMALSLNIQLEPSLSVSRK